jgi:hypothetical protein
MDVPEGYQEGEQLMKDRPVIKLQWRFMVLCNPKDVVQ